MTIVEEKNLVKFLELQNLNFNIEMTQTIPMFTANFMMFEL